MAKPVITDKPVIDKAEFNGITIWRKEGGSIEVSETNYPSMKAALQDIAAKAGIKLEEGWNTQYMGWYIIQQLKGHRNNSASQQNHVLKSLNLKDDQTSTHGGEPKQNKFAKTGVWIIIALLLLGAAAFGIFGRNPSEVKMEENTVVSEALYIKQIEEIEKNFNAAESVVGWADLSDDEKFVLHNLAKVLHKNPQLKLRLEVHSSAEGDAAFNQKLSEDLATVAVTFLVEHEGVDVSRLEAVGYGSTQLKNTTGPSASENRRTEFVVVE